MALFDTIRAGASGAEDEYTIERSIRMDGSNGYLTRTPTSTGNRKIWTWSGWVKRTRLDNNDYIFTCTSQSGNDGIAALYWKSGNNKLQFYFDTDGSNPYGDVNNRDYRDVGSWYHIVWQVDASNTTHRIWVNGVEENITGGQPPNYSYAMNRSGYVQTMGTQGWDGNTNRAHMYFAECHYSDGYKYEASDFGEINSETGVWSPKKVAINYGTNGFYLNFSDNSNNTAATLGKDYSGNGNNWTPNGISVSAGVGNDSLEDTPTNNFCTLNRLNNIQYNATYNTIMEEGGLLMRGGDNVAGATMTYPKSGKWYCEFSKYGNGFSQGVSVVRADTDIRNLDGVTSHASKVTLTTYPELLVRGTNVSNNGTAWENDANAVIGVAVDMDNGAMYFAINNTWINSGDPTSGSSKTGAVATDLLTVNNGYHYVAPQGYNGNNNSGMYANFGQRPFTYTAPTGYKTLCTKNLPDPAFKNSTKHFETLLYTGDNTSNNQITGLNFAPDFVWLKRRDSSVSHGLFDTVRGARKLLYSDSTNTENQYGSLHTFNSDGFRLTTGGEGNASGGSYVAWNWNAGATDGKTYTVKVVSDSGNKYRFDDFGTSAVTLDLAEGGTYIFDQSDSSNSGHPLRFSTTSNGTHGGGSEYTTGVTTSGTPGSSGAYTQIVVAASAPTLYYYCTQHSGMGGQANTNSTLGSSNFDGAIQSVVKANATAGFSIVGYVGNGQNNTDVTIGHGLGVTPAMVIVKKRDSGGSEGQWTVLHQKLTSGKNIFLQTYTGEGSYINYIKSMGSSTFTVRTNDASAGRVNRSGNNYIAYVFADVEGFSKFGSYVGNGNSNGAFIYLGFRPAFFLLKAKTSDISWYMYDNKRDPDNYVDKELNPHNTQSEASGHDLDFLSNGVKIRSSDSSLNYSNYEYIYWAFAESSFKYSRAR